jgi:hypothetical protein
MNQHIQTKWVIFVLSLALGSFTCNRQRHISGTNSSIKKMPTEELILIDSLAPSEKLILEEGISFKRSLPELDTNQNAKYSIGIIRFKGEIFRVDSFTSQIKQISFTHGKIDTFFLSPNRKYVACIKVVATGKEPGMWEDEEPPEVKIFSIVVMNILQDTTIRELQTKDWNVYFDKWISNSRLRYTTADGFAVSNYYVYDAIRDTLQRVPYGSKD